MYRRNKNARLLTGGLVGAPSGTVGRRGVGTEATLRTRGYLGAAPALAVDTFATLDPTSKGTYAILSENNLKITNNNNSWGSAKTDIAIPAGGKVYFEVLMNSLYGMFGVTKSDSAKNSYLGWVSDGWALYPLTTKNELFHDTDNTVQWGTSTSGGPSNRIFMCAVDRSTGEMFFGADGNWFTGDETEVSSFASALPGFTDADLSSGSLFPAVSVLDPGGTPPSGILNFGWDHTFAGAKTALATPYTDANGLGEFYHEPPAGYVGLYTTTGSNTGMLTLYDRYIDALG